MIVVVVYYTSSSGTASARLTDRLGHCQSRPGPGVGGPQPVAKPEAQAGIINLKFKLNFKVSLATST
jgi:hypothetical protein